MSAGPVFRAVRGGLGRRRVQTVVIGLVVLVSTAATVLALGLVVVSNAPFDHAFAAQRGADVSASIDASRATAAQLAATMRLPAVAAAAGPFAEVTVTPEAAGGTLPPLTLVGRSSRGGPVDDIVLVSGHWVTGPGQVVLDTGQDSGPQLDLPLGTKLSLTGLPGAPTLTVVGTARSVTNSAGGWVAPAEVPKLRAPGSPASAEELYRFRSAGNAAAIGADVSDVERALPPGAVAGTESYLSARTQENDNIAPFVPFLIAFGVIGIVMSALIVANVVSGAVVAGYRRIGILKSIGFTPAQVAGAYAGQVAVPAVVGCLVGVVLGNLLAVPLLAKTATVFGVGSLRIPLWVDVAVPVGICALAALAALVPALRAGRLSTVEAISTGRAPRSGRGYRAHRLLGRLPLPRPVSLGLAAPFARPGRSGLTLAAVVLGATAVTFAVGLTSSLRLVVAGVSHSAAQPVQVMLSGPVPGPGVVAAPGQSRGPSAANQRTVVAALRAQPGTLRFVAEAQAMVGVAGLSQPVPATVFRGNATWTGYDLVRGRWYQGPGQIDVPTGFLAATGTSVGDTVTLLLNGRDVPVRIVGEVFDTHNRGVSVITGWGTLAGRDPTLMPDQYDVGLRPGTSATAYAQQLGSRLGSDYYVALNERNSGVVDVMIGLITTLTLLLALVAALGVLNTVVLQTRERVHDLGVFKAVGMTPRQTIVMVVCTVTGIGLVAGLIAVPAGIALHHYVLPAMASAAGLALPASFLDVYTVPEAIALAVAGTVIAIAGALLPASWAANSRTGEALHAE